MIFVLCLKKQYKMKPDRVSIIVLNFNGLEDTKKCLKSLLQTRYSNFEIIVADNGSKINESLILKKEFSNQNLKFLRFKKNYGFSGGNNKALRYAKGEYIAFLNNDVIVKPAWLKPLLNLLHNDKSIAVVQPKILWLKNKKYFDYSGACGGFIDKFGYPFTRGRLFDTIEKDKGQYDKPCDIFWASGAAFLTRRKIIDEIGLFDEIFFNYMEEIDFCFRVLKAGYRVVSQPKSVVYHKVAATAGKDALKKRFWEHRNNLVMILKNYPLKKLVLVFPQRLIFEYISFFYYLTAGKLNFAVSVLLSQFSLIKMLPAVLQKRKSDKFSVTFPQKGIYEKSIVFDYFARNKKKFSKLKINE